MRVTNIQGVDLTTFQFDWDLTWAAFFMNGEGRIYARFFGRDQTSAMSHLSMEGLLATMKSALEVHKKEAKDKPEKRPPARWKKIDDIPAFTREQKGKNCIHCHMVNEYDRLEAADKKTYTKSLLWNYPPPETWGWVLDSAKIKSVKKDSFADKAGLKEGDVIKSINDVRILAVGDIFFAINYCPDKGDVKVVYLREGKEATTAIKLEGDWRQSDISWRASIWRTSPIPGFYGQEISLDDKKKLGLAGDTLAIKINGTQPGLPADKAGIKQDDIVTALGGETKAMDARHFQAWFRINANPGDSLKIKYLRGGKPGEASLVFPK